MVERRLTPQAVEGNIPFNVGKRDNGPMGAVRRRMSRIFGKRDIPTEEPTRGKFREEQAGTTVENNGRNGERKEKKEPEEMRPLTPEDVDKMVEDGWFEDWNRIKGLKGDTINERTYPEVWNDETRKKFKDEVLMPFYFPEGPVHIAARDEKGNLIREVDVNRKSYAFTWNGELKAVRSYIDQDPWASESDYNNPKFKMAHAQMFIVAPGKENEDKGFGTGMAAKFHEEIFKQGFTHIITWVNREGIDYGFQEQFFEKMGYTEDRRQKGKITINPTDPDRKLAMRKYWLTPKGVQQNLISKDNIWVKWERKKGKLMLEEARKRFSA